jgi:AraC-like DNA-binding protein
MRGEQIVLSPGHPLAAFVQGIWQISVDAPSWRQRVLPRNIVNVLFPLRGTLRVTEAIERGRPSLRQAPFLVGLQSRPIVSEADGGLVLLGLSLRAEASRALLSLPAREVTDLTISADDVLANAGELFARLQEAPGFRDRCGLLLRWVAGLVRTPAPLARVQRACSLLTRPAESTAMDAAAAAVGCSSRHLRRVFLDYVGVTPAEYVQLRRFDRALPLLRRSQSLTEVALDAGYYDQAHFCRDFKEISGLTPGDYRAQAGPVPGVLFSEDVRLIQAPRAPLP